MDVQRAQEKARVVCQKYGLDAEVYELGGAGGQIIVGIIDPSRPDKSAASYPEERLRALVAELESAMPGCRIMLVVGGRGNP